jgi:hypothetical protein
MNKMEDGEVRRMAIFKLRHVARQFAELEQCAAGAQTRSRLLAVRRALMAAAKELQVARLIIVEGDDEAQLAAR